jgi:hypothetical protein
MSTVHIVLGRTVRDGSRVNIVPLSTPVGVDTINATGSSQQSSLVATAVDRQFWSVTTKATDVYVNFGANPTAAADNGWYIPAGSTREFAVTSTGERIAVINHA